MNSAIQFRLTLQSVVVWGIFIFGVGLFLATGLPCPVLAQDTVEMEGEQARLAAQGATPTKAQGAVPAKAQGAGLGYRIRMPEVIRRADVDRLLGQLQELVSHVDPKARRRPVVVLDFSDERLSVGPSEATESGGSGRFEDALAIARYLTSSQSRNLRTIAFLNRPLRGHANLVVIACDDLVVSSRATMGIVGDSQGDSDDAVVAVYQKIAAGRGVFPEAVVDAMVRPALGLYRVTMVDGTERFVNSAEMELVRREAGAWKEEILAAADQPLQISGAKLREFRWASDYVDSLDQLGERLGVDQWSEVEGAAVVSEAMRFLEWSGAVNARRSSRVIANLGAALRDERLEGLVLSVDSQGGSLESSLRLAMMLANPDDGLRRVVGYVPYQALGDSAFLAVAASPLYLHPDARLGGEGNEFIDRRALGDLREAIDEFARISGRSSALLRGLLDPELDVFRCAESRTGVIGYLTSEELADEPEGKWIRGERVDFSKGVTANDAVELGLAEGVSPTLETALDLAGVSGVPPALEERRIIHAIEWLSGFSWLPRILIFFAFTTFVMEMNAPGLGIPGFISLVCFLLFFWLSFLAGTAEWLEVLLFVGGLACLMLEIFVIPGVGVFGVGGLVMVVSAIVLASQTFVVPQNDYQFHQTMRGVLTVVFAMVGIVLGIISLRYVLPGTPFFKHLSMPGPKSEEMHEQIAREHLVHYEDLLGEEGVAVTPLLPGGKVRFGEQIVAVVSQGAAMEPGSRVKVVLVQGNRIVVDECDSVA